QPDEKSEENQRECASQYQPDNVAAIRAQRHSHANFADSASGIVGSNSIEPNRSQDKRKNSEEGSEARDEPLLGELNGYLLAQSANRNDRQIGVYGSHCLAKACSGHACPGTAQNNYVIHEERSQIALRVVGLCFRQIEERADRLIEIDWQIARIFSDAHHFNKWTAGARCAAEVLADGIFVPEKLPCKRFIDNRYFSRGRCILPGDAAPSDDRGSNHVKVARHHSIPCGEVFLQGPW